MVRALHVPRFVDASSSHPRAVRLLNAIGRLVPRFGRYSADAWWAAARKGDLADCDPTPEAREALEALVDSIESDVRLNLVGRFSAKSDTGVPPMKHIGNFTLRDVNSLPITARSYAGSSDSRVPLP